MVSLHVHSVHSFLQGTISIPDLIKYAKKSESSFVCLTDTNRMSGLIELARLAKEENLKPIFGAFIDDPENKKLNTIIIAKNRVGYSELCKTITTRNLKEGFQLTSLFENISNNMFYITASLDLLKLVNITEELKRNLYVELIITNKQKRITRTLYEFARTNNLKIVASAPAYFLRQEDYNLHLVVSAIRLNKPVAQLTKEDIVDEEFFLITDEELLSEWKKIPEALLNIKYIVQNCNVELEIGKYKFPSYPLPLGETAYSYLWKIAFKGLSIKYKPLTEKAIARLQYELEVIDELGYSDYFLVVWDIVNEARRRNMMNIGRGSAANSLVAYCLGFTQMDPIKHNLYFERFLNKGRKSPPDVDLDFSWKERDSLVKYVYEKYSYDKVAFISTHVTFRARSAFRSTAKAFGVSDAQVSEFSKFIPWTKAENLPILSQKFPEAKNVNFKDDFWVKIIEIASQLGGIPRNASIHPCGIIISKESITNYVALEYASNKGVGLIITQPDMYPIEDLGLVKIDLLSQRSLGVLKDAMQMVDKNYG
ncbi:MAG: DNA polymerase III subunit alpha [Ignavibacteriales bacterium]|nr:DNA polymerase III subunit alpha [Ignavibacteriota bacterium]MCB9249372.1 DNA polymerase III subunit alpha [Ignavibacteriales bacterium]